MKCGLCFKGFSSSFSCCRRIVRPSPTARMSEVVSGTAARLCSAVSRPHPLPPSLGPSLPEPGDRIESEKNNG